MSARFGSVGALIAHLNALEFTAEQCGTDDPAGPDGALYVIDHGGRPREPAPKTIVKLRGGEAQEPGEIRHSEALRIALGLPRELPIADRVRHLLTDLVQLDSELIGADRGLAAAAFEGASCIDSDNAAMQEREMLARSQNAKRGGAARALGKRAKEREFIARLRARSLAHEMIGALLRIENHKDF